MPPPAPAPTPHRAATAHPAEIGWLPDLVYTGEKFESGLAFFADAHGRIARFSREPRDLEVARKLPGQAALPGQVNTHAVSWQRVLRGRTERTGRTGDAMAGLAEALGQAAGRLSPEDLFEIARMAFVEMLLSGITCVGEFHEVHHRPDGTPWPERNEMARQVLRAAREAGIRIALFNVAAVRAGRAGAPSVPASFRAESVDAFLRDTDLLRQEVEREFAADEAWIGVAPESLATVPADGFKTIANYAHTHRLRLQTRLAETAAEVQACAAEFGRSPLAVLAEHGIVDKRFTALHGTHLDAEEAKVLSGARASLCVCPEWNQNLGRGMGPVSSVLAGGGGVALGSAGLPHVDLLKHGRALEYALRTTEQKRPALGSDPAKVLFHAATFAGARSLGATGGALEVGRPADFFTVSIYDPSLAGADADTLLANLMFAGERRAVREVWVGARQRISGGRHPNQGAIVGRFVEGQRRRWGTP